MKRTTIAVSYLLACVLFTFTACKKDAAPKEVVNPENNTSVPVENGRLAFKTTADFYKHIDVAKTDEAAKAGFRSLYTALKEANGSSDQEARLSPTLADLAAFDFQTGFLATLNEKGEVKVGDEIIWYNKGNKYFIPASDEANLETIKKAPEKIKKVLPTYIANVDARAYVNVNGGLDARHQSDPFWPTFPPVGSNRKLVHEIYGRFDGYYDVFPGIQGFKTYLILRLKMEWEGAHGWNANASEERTEIIDITGNATLPGISTPYGSYTKGPNFTVSEQRVTRENYDVTLASYDGLGNLTDNRWSTTITGTITSFVNGDSPANRWINAGTLWD